MAVWDTQPFTAQNFYSQLEELDADQEINGEGYFQRLNDILNSIQSSTGSNINEIKNVKQIFSKYVSKKADLGHEENQALVSLVFKDLQSTGSLKEFGKVLRKWNTTLLLLHQLLKSDSPKEISLVGIQSGSIDVIFNIDIDISINLTEIIKTGLKVLALYLAYKLTLKKQFLETFPVNSDLIKLEEQKDELMLESIKTSVKTKITELHEANLKTDSRIDTISAQKRIDEVSEAIIDHIIKGNEVKLLTPPKREGGEYTKEGLEQPDISKELREDTALVREHYKQLSQEDKNLLLRKYGIPSEADN